MDDAIAKSLERFRNRKIHNAITVDLLNQLTDSDLEQALIDMSARDWETTISANARLYRD